MVDSMLWAAGWLTAVAALAVCFADPGRPRTPTREIAANADVGWESLHSVPGDVSR